MQSSIRMVWRPALVILCVYLIYCTSYFLFPPLPAARHVVLSSASALPCTWKREQGRPGVWARRAVGFVHLGRPREPQLVGYDISCYYSLHIFLQIA